MRFRRSGWTTDDGKVVTHCTIDTGDDTCQTAVTFRSSDIETDVLAVTRPYPKSTTSEYDSSNSALWR